MKKKKLKKELRGMEDAHRGLDKYNDELLEELAPYRACFPDILIAKRKVELADRILHVMDTHDIEGFLLFFDDLLNLRQEITHGG